MNKKIIYLFAVLVAGIFLLSACQQDAVGIKMNKNKANDKTLIGGVIVRCGTCTGDDGDFRCIANINTNVNGDVTVTCNANEGCKSSCSGGSSTTI